jgi:peptidoglycan-associated lipoprotein
MPAGWNTSGEPLVFPSAERWPKGARIAMTDRTSFAGLAGLARPAAWIVPAVLAIGCGGAPPPPAQSASAPPPPPPAQAVETPAQAATSGNIEVAPDILKACGLSEADAFFPFDSSRLERQDIIPLNSIAVCFTTGPLKSKSMRLVGRADPRGGADYNMTLGQSRADAVEKYLANKGLQKGKAESTSRGALDATGQDEAGWTHDRRVDVVLGN